jgi:hypothetical protein
MVDSLKKLFDSKPKSKSSYRTVGPTQIIADGPIRIEAQLQVRQKTAEEQTIWELNRKASELKETNLSAAIAYLAEAQVMRPTVPHEYSASEYLRLPVFLQQDGRMAEAEDEFQKIIRLFKGGYDRANIYDKMRMAYQREKRFDEAVSFGVMAIACEIIGIQHRGKHEESNLKRLLKEHEKMTGDQKERYQKYIDSSTARIQQNEIDKQNALDRHRDRLPEDVKKLLKKIKKEALLPDILSDFNLFFEKPSLVACQSLGGKVTKRVLRS